MGQIEGFRQKMAIAQAMKNSLVCVGLDPLAEKIPDCIKRHSGSGVVAFKNWMIPIVDTTAPFTSIYKPQSAYWEAIPGGREAMQAVIAHIHQNYPEIMVFLDCKRGDIDRTQQQYKEAHFGLDCADGMNFSSYMGSTCMKSLIDSKYPGRALVGLCYTTNPDAREVQDLKLADGRLLWEAIAEMTLGWAEKFGVVEDAGLVMAAAYENPKGSGVVYSDHLRRCREIVGKKLWFLIPGIGTQGGVVEETVGAAFCGWGSIAINSSSGIIFASQNDDFAEAAGKKVKELRNQINHAIKP